MLACLQMDPCEIDNDSNAEKHPHTDLLEGEPAAGRVGGVGWVSQSLQGRDNGITVGLLEPVFVWCLSWSFCDAAGVIQGENHWTHQSRVLLTHNGNLFIPAAQKQGNWTYKQV